MRSMRCAVQNKGITLNIKLGHTYNSVYFWTQALPLGVSLKHTAKSKNPRVNFNKQQFLSLQIFRHGIDQGQELINGKPTLSLVGLTN